MQKLSGTCSQHVQATLNGQAVNDMDRTENFPDSLAEQSLAIQAKVGLINERRGLKGVAWAFVGYVTPPGCV
jgi:hypothetical protein